MQLQAKFPRAGLYETYGMTEGFITLSLPEDKALPGKIATVGMPIFGGEMVGFPIINRQLFGEKAPLGAIYSFEMIGASTGMGVGGWLGGVLFDVSGTYTSAIFAAAAIGYLGLPLALWLPRHAKTALSRSEVASAA